MVDLRFELKPKWWKRLLMASIDGRGKYGQFWHPRCRCTLTHACQARSGPRNTFAEVGGMPMWGVNAVSSGDAQHATKVEIQSRGDEAAKGRPSPPDCEVRW